MSRRRSRNQISDNKPVETLVAEIIKNVRETRRRRRARVFAAGSTSPSSSVFEVTPAEREAALDELAPQTRADTEFAIANVRRFAEAQLATILPLEIETLPGVHLGHRVIPIERVGCYVPGGRYPLLSAPIMTIVPAKVAGVDEVIACLPPNAHRAMIAGCHLSGADRIFKIGGAQAIAALAFGTESVPAVNKIVGPGNAFVNEAKRQVFGPVGIDQLAGPSEIFIVADCDRRCRNDRDRHAGAGRARRAHARRPDHHGPRACRSDAQGGRKAARDALDRQCRRHGLERLWRDRRLRGRGGDDRLFRLSSPPSICRSTPPIRRPWPRSCATTDRCSSAQLASVVYSDKCVGTNHTLPTMGAGRYTGGLWVGAYVKIATHQWLDERGVKTVAPPAARQSASETLEGHRRAAQLRLDRMQA